MARLRLFFCAISAIPVAFVFTACGASSVENTVPTNPTYTISVTALNPASMTAGGTSSATITLTPTAAYSGSVTLACGSLTGNAAPTCAFSNNPIIVNGTAAATSTLTVSTTSSTPGGSYSISVTGKDGAGLSPSNGPQSLSLAMTAVIQHIVIIFQENRTPDNLFQDPVLIGRGADIASSGINSTGQTIALSLIDLGTAGTNPQTYDLGHTNASFVAMYDGGKMDGADLVACSPNCPANPQFMYVNPADIQPYFAMAEQYTFGDRMFQTNQGPSFPAHQFIISGTSAPSTTSKLFAAENPNSDPAGCIAASTDTVEMIDPSGNESSTQYPCFDHATLTDSLDAAGVSWRYYAPSAGSIWTGPDAINHICQPQTVSGKLTCTGPDWVNNVIIPEWQVLEDIADGNLAQVSWIIPDGSNSDHPGTNDGTGPSWVTSIVNEIGDSQYWANTAIIITWDDWGGWYDHVAPKVVNDGVSWGSGYIYGFRVPLVIVSPYAKAKYVSHTTHDFGSILKYIETAFSLPSLGYADASADDLSDCFDLSQSPIPFQMIPTTQSAGYFINRKKPPVDPDDD